MYATPRANALHILIAASVMMSLAMGMRQCLGLFLPPMTQALSLSASDFTFAIAVQNIVWGLAQAPLGAVADRWGLRPVMVLGAMAYVAAMAIMTAATGVWTFVLALVFVGIGIACTGSSLAMTATARAASPERRSVVLGIVGAFSSVGTLVIAPVLQALLGVWDWRWGAVLFVILAAAMVPAAMVTGRVDRLPQPSLQRVSAAAAIGEALRNRRFVVLCCTHFVCGLQLIFINTHLPNYLALCGQDPMLGATALAIIGGINIAGCLLAGYLGQRYLKNVLLGITYLARSAVLMIYFMFPPTPAPTIVFAAAMGVISDVLGWLEDGADLDEDVVPALRAAAARMRPGSRRSFARVRARVAESGERRTRGLPAVDLTQARAPPGRASNSARALRALDEEIPDGPVQPQSFLRIAN